MLLKGSLEESVGFLFFRSVDVLREIGCIYLMIARLDVNAN